MKFDARKIVLYGSLLLLALDQLTKAAAQKYLTWYDGPSKRFFGLIDFKFTMNPGMLLGVGSKSHYTVWISIILAFVLIFVLIYGFRYYNKKYPILRYCTQLLFVFAYPR